MYTFTDTDIAISNVINVYRRKWNKITDEKFFQYTSDDKKEIIDLINENLRIITSFVGQDISINGKLWIDCFYSELITTREFILSNAHYLIASDSFKEGNNCLGIGFNGWSGWLEYKINYGIENFDTGDIAERFIIFLKKIKKNLWEGLKNKITLSKVCAKYNIGNLIQKTPLANILNLIVNDVEIESYRTIVKNNAQFIKSQFVSKKLKDEANYLLFDFYIFLTKEYYPNIVYGGNAREFKLEKSTILTDVENNNYSFKKDNITYYINGLGLNTQDLTKKDIGICFMEDSNWSGFSIFQALLKANNDNNIALDELFSIGIINLKKIKNNILKNLILEIASVYVDKGEVWKPEIKNIWWNDDCCSSGFRKKIDDSPIVDIDQNVNFDAFFAWVNADKWFSGFDMTKKQFPTLNGIDFLLSDYEINGGLEMNPLIKNKNNNPKKLPYQYVEKHIPTDKCITPINISEILGVKEDPINCTDTWGISGNTAYKYLTLGMSPLAEKKFAMLTNNEILCEIPPEVAYISASHMIHDLLLIRDKTAPIFNQAFYDTGYDYTLRIINSIPYLTIPGNGSSEHMFEGYGGLYVNINPFSAIPKWAFTSMLIREGVPGDLYRMNYQMKYANKNSFVPKFSSVAFNEGWRAFAEWLAVEFSFFGKIEAPSETRNYYIDKIPSFGCRSNNINVTKFKRKYEFANGAYWVERDHSSYKTSPGNSQKLFDAMQYFGLINQRLKRSILCILEVALHSGCYFTDIELYPEIRGVGLFKKFTGWSLSRVRKFLVDNSAVTYEEARLESIKLMCCPGQSSSFYKALIINQTFFMYIIVKYKLNFPKNNFFDEYKLWTTKRNTARIFHEILKNGPIPINVLTKFVSEFFDSWIPNNENQYGK